MKNFVQYHNTDNQGGRPNHGEDGYVIFAGKSINHLMGHRVWLISGEGPGKKRFFLEYTFVVSDIERGVPNKARGRQGHRFAPAVPLSGRAWFESFKKSQQNFSLGVREIDDTFIGELEALLVPTRDEGPGVLAAAETLPLDQAAAMLQISADPQCAEISSTQRSALIMARIGQGGFRRDVSALWDGKCAVTACNIDQVLIASHAKPWAQSTNQERLDPFNGLLLAATVDKLFDRGLISFTDQGSILVVDRLSDAQLQQVGLTRASVLKTVDPRHKAYLRFHREHVFGKAPPSAL